jgi:hypothetical protein
MRSLHSISHDICFSHRSTCTDGLLHMDICYMPTTQCKRGVKLEPSRWKTRLVVVVCRWCNWTKCIQLLACRSRGRYAYIQAFCGRCRSTSLAYRWVMKYTWRLVKFLSIVMFRNTKKKRLPTVSWLILFRLSVLSWAFVLSGLTMETSIRFVSGSSSGVTVSGINQTTMNNRPPGTIINAAVQSWGSGTQAEIPRWGAFYTHPGSKIVVNTTTPNILPGNASEGIFLPAQANLPITGSAWGLM